MKNKQKQEPVFKRSSGILVHPTSFPSPYGIGDLGQGALDFIDFLKRSGQKLWQVLPLTPTGYGDSPYQSFSSYAGQPLIISPDSLIDLNLLDKSDVLDIPEFNPNVVDYGPLIIYKTKLQKLAYSNFLSIGSAGLREDYAAFCQGQSHWLNDYALFMALKDAHDGQCWLNWDETYKYPTQSLKKEWSLKFYAQMGYYKFIQFIFYSQWSAVRDYAHKNDIKVIGDIPIYVPIDSADVWGNQDLFDLDSKGFPLSVAGVPPDYFSSTGQLWGNPLYNWAQHKKTGYKWWINRIKSQFTLIDYLRIDHFRGFESYWAVPYGDETAMNGCWLPGPGKDIFIAIEKALGKGLPIIAEDLGLITKEVEDLRDAFDLPGMKVLQFAFDDIEDNDLMPHHYHSNCVCYTGTHDNNTTMGWYNQASETQRDKVRRYMNTDGNTVNWDFIRICMGSVAQTSIVPLQDILSLGSDARMNTPGTPCDNWGWRFTSDSLSPSLADYLFEATKLFGRL